MKPTKVRSLILCYLILISVPPGIVRGRNTQSSIPSNKNKVDDLKLPSFSIFGFPSSPKSKERIWSVDLNDLDQFIAKVEKYRAIEGEGKWNRNYWIIPVVLYKVKDLFSKSSWTDEEIRQGQHVSNFFARLTNDPALKIERSDQESFRSGLRRLTKWFTSWCQDDKTLASMIFTLDDGPFFGEDVAVESVSRMKAVESVPIPDHQANLVLMTDGKQPEPLIIGVLNSNGSAKWLKRFSAKPRGVIAGATLLKGTIVKVEGYGYMCRLVADWSFGEERGHLYLDESLNLRFYFLSW